MNAAVVLMAYGSPERLADVPLACLFASAVLLFGGGELAVGSVFAAAALATKRDAIAFVAVLYAVSFTAVLVLVPLLRNPVERAFSHYLHEVRAGREDLSFEQAIDAEAHRIAGEEDRMAADPCYRSLAWERYSYTAGRERISSLTLRGRNRPSRRSPWKAPASTITFPRSTVTLGHAVTTCPSHGV